MPRSRRKPLKLSPAQRKSADYITRIETDWRASHPEDIDISKRELARRISACFRDPKRGISESGYGKWRNGQNIPDLESTYAFAQFFDRPIEEVFTAFGHSLPLTFASFYELAKRTAIEEHWEDADAILNWLEVTLAPEWATGDLPQWLISVAKEALEDDESVYNRALHLVDFAHAYDTLQRIQSLGLDWRLQKR